MSARPTSLTCHRRMIPSARAFVRRTITYLLQTLVNSGFLHDSACKLLYIFRLDFIVKGGSTNLSHLLEYACDLHTVCISRSRMSPSEDRNCSARILNLECRVSVANT